MKAIIIAGGRGERLRPITDTIPKPMIEVAGKSLLEHTIEMFRHHGIKDIILALCYLPEVIQDYFGDGTKFGVHITYTFEDSSNPLGTAGAILHARKYIDNTFIVTYADILRELDITTMIDRHISAGAIATINAYRHTGNNFKSVLEFDDKNIIKKFTELEKSQKLEDCFQWSNGSFYILEPEVFDFISLSGQIDFARHVFPSMIKANKKVMVFPFDGYFIDIGTNENLDKARMEFKKIKRIG